MTTALWVAGAILAYLFIGGFLNQIANKKDKTPGLLIGFILLWPILMTVGFGMQMAKKVRR